MDRPVDREANWGQHMRRNVHNWLLGDVTADLCESALILFGNPYLFQRESFLGQFEEIEQVGLFHNVASQGRWITCCGPLFGAPMTAMYLEVLADRGVGSAVACGYVGSISPDSEIGSYGVVTKVCGLDGTTRAYSPCRSSFCADQMLISILQQRLDQAEASYVAGSAVSIDALLLEDDATIREFHRQGHCFVDLETACFYALGSMRGIRTAALHIVTDNPTRKTIDVACKHEASFGEQLQIAVGALRAIGE